MNPSFRRRRFLRGLAASALVGLSPSASVLATTGPRVLHAGPDSYRALLRELKPGDTLALEPGEYRSGLPIHGLIGTAERPIVIEGPSRADRAMFVARTNANTVSVIDSAHVIVRNLVLDGQGHRVDAVKAEGHARWAHHITLERLTIINHGADQQTVGISTKCAAWGWVVRGCTVTGAGTGMYFGNSDGSAPFLDGLIEGNRVTNPVGYALQIKHQRPRPSLPLMPTARATTIVRRNVLVKSEGGSTAESARPNMLVGHWPLVGPGMDDRYLVYGNLFFDNPNEALFQGEGNVALYHNLFFNPHGEAVRIQPHNDKPREVAVFRNTIVAAALGIEFSGGEPGYARLFEHNLAFGNPPIHSEIAGDNRLGSYEQAAAAFARLHADIDSLDLTPTADFGKPDTALPAPMLSFPGTRDDYLGRSRGSGGFGACLLRTGSDSMRCGLPASVPVMR